ncbi:unnamed protein product [Linum tenue]|uniref:Lysine-specific demethylase JMJ16 n=1 Tax=Linum tenue TaxID=586396 RepID=A0AAV0LJB7_9ROSI|nr:unnamed protein product [Linum tenue]
MRTKRVARKKGSLNRPRLHPRVESQTSFKLRKVDSTEQRLGPTASVTDEKASAVIDGAMLKSLSARRPWILHDLGDGDHMQEEASSNQEDTEHSSYTCLPKGIARGCPDCRDCVKVMARWQPEKGKKHVLEEAPVFHPNEEEFKETLKYITSIRSRAEPYGICRIVPPPSWHPPSLITEKNMWEDSIFESQVQRIDGMQAQNLGEIVKCSDMEGVGLEPGPKFTLKTFKKYADDFASQYFCIDGILDSEVDSNERVEQREPSLMDIEGEYGRIIDNPTEEIEVICGDNLDSQVFGSGFPVYKSSETCTSQEYLDSGWNLNKTAVLPDSLLSFESYSTSGLLRPRLRVGMCFSSFPWKLAMHHMYYLSYMHIGAPKIWYAIPGSHGSKFEIAIKDYLRESPVEHSKMQHNRQKGSDSYAMHLLVQLMKLTLTRLKSDGLPVYRCIQCPGEFVLVLPRTRYSGFDSGFNCAESIHLAPVEWLPHGQNSAELYSEQGRRTFISQDKMLIGAAREAVKAQWLDLLSFKDISVNARWKEAAGKDGILLKALKLRIELEASRRKYLCNSSQSKKMDKDFDTTSKKECIVCYYDLHLSAATCPCSADRYSCLNHAKQLCSCPWVQRIFLYRYEIDELRVLIEAVGGKLSAIYKWAKNDLNLSLLSIVSDKNRSLGRRQLGEAECSIGESDGKGKGKFYDPSVPYGGWNSSASGVREELKARVLQWKSLKEKKLKDKSSVKPTSHFTSAAADAAACNIHMPEVSSDSTSESSSSL